MAKLFNISLPADSAPLKLRAKQKATVTYTVSNLSGRNVRGRAVLKPDDPAVKNKWVTLPPDAEKDYDATSSFRFPVTVDIPASAAPGKYTFRLDAVNAEITDEGDTGPTASFEILATEKSKMPGWIIPVAAVVLLLIIGTVLFFVLHKPAPDIKTTLVAMPNEVGKNAADANDELTKLHFTVTVSSKPSTAADANKVISQSVDKDTKVDPATTTVALTVGAPALRVPSLVGLTYADAMARLSQQQFHNVQSDNRPVQNVNPGFVSAQIPDAGTEVQADVAIHMTVAAQLITVPQVTGMAFGNAVLRLRQASLDYGSVTGVQADGIVQSQSPAPNAQVPVGTKINLTLPGCGGPFIRCVVLNPALTQAALVKNNAFRTTFNISQPKLLPK